MNWFNPSDHVVLKPEVERSKFWKKKYGMDCIEVASHVIYANNGHGRLFDAVYQAYDSTASIRHDFRDRGYCHYQVSDTCCVTIYRTPEPTPYAATDLEFLISAGTREILFLNGAGRFQSQIPVGSILLPQQLVREDGTSYHYAPPEILLSTNKILNEHIGRIAENQRIQLMCGEHWTTDSIHRTFFDKVEKFCEQGVLSVDMELSALAGVAYYRHCALSALLLVTDIVSRSHTWDSVNTAQFHQGVQQVAQLAAGVFPLDLKKQSD
jgi:uridine phosphorylase